MPCAATLLAAYKFFVLVQESFLELVVRLRVLRCSLLELGVRGLGKALKATMGAHLMRASNRALP